MKGELKNRHSMLLEVQDRGEGRNLIGNLYYGGGKRTAFSISPSEEGGGKDSLQKFMHREMKVVEEVSEREKVFKTNFDLLNIASWLERDPKAVSIYESGGLKELLRYLKSLREVLGEPLAAPEKIDGHVNLPEVREAYENLIEKIGSVPDGPKVTKEVCVKISGAESEYEAYREKADEVLREVKDTIRSVENTINEVEYL